MANQEPGEATLTRPSSHSECCLNAFLNRTVQWGSHIANLLWDLALPAQWAIPLKDDLVAQHLKTVAIRDREGLVFYGVCDILNRLTVEANKMMMMGNICIIAGHFGYRTYLLNESHLMKPLEGLINCTQGNHGEAFSNLLVNLLSARMLLCMVKSLINCQTLVGYLQSVLSQCCNEILVAHPLHHFSPLLVVIIN
jgi:hypothetical protein